MQLRRWEFGISPALGQSWQVPLKVIWLSGQEVQFKRSGMGKSPGLGQSWQIYVKQYQV